MKQASSDVQFSKLEETILEFWEKNNIFTKQNSWRHDKPFFSFYDGPPFANGLPHYGHMLANTIKDSVPRYWIMKGYQVERRFGWDCHGLPVEFEIEKNMGLKGRGDIQRMGVGTFNEECRKSVLHYCEEWKKTINRMGRWVDWDNQYRTMDPEFMESVWWVFEQLYNRGLIYQDFKVVPYSPRTGSVVSNFEANQNYKSVQDPSVVVRFFCPEKNWNLLAWTTTPWSLPGNLALAVHPDLDYAVIKDHKYCAELGLEDSVFVISLSRIPWFYGLKDQLLKNTKTEHFEILKIVKGTELIGLNYEPIFDYYKDHPNSFKVLPGTFITTDDGTGIVHQAPAYGEDDFATCKVANIKLVDPIDENGCFSVKIEEFQGQYFKDADKAICKKLKETKKILRHETIVHNYPFDERTDTPLMYKAVPSWYVAVETIVHKLVANNQQIRWVPSHLKDGRMGTWLKNARDWAISRNRFWGTPLPVWTCNKDPQHLKVIASKAQLETETKTKIEDLHLHFLSKLEVDCPHCTGKMRIVDVVFDCWFESGSMPYAQLHYPFENKEKFDSVFPGNFIAEGLDQTRGWFYTLIVLSSALFDQPAFKNVVVNGVILDETGKKMSKRHRNYTPPEDLINKFGADSVRLYMLRSPLLRAEDLIFKDEGVLETTRTILLPLWNSYSFLSTYAHANHYSVTDFASLTSNAPSHKLDKWVLSRIQTLKINIYQHMEAYELYKVVSELIEFIDSLTNWYIRLSRRRFWGESGQTKLAQEQQEPFDTLSHVLKEFTTLLAPFAPFVSESLYQYLTDGQKNLPESVHLCDLPSVQEEFINPNLEKEMSEVRSIVNLGRSLRQKAKIKIRQALSTLTIVCEDEETRKRIKNSEEILLTELNIKQLVFDNDELSFVTYVLKPNFAAVGKKLGSQLGAFKTYLLGLNSDESAKIVHLFKSGESLEWNGYKLSSEDITLERKALEDRLSDSFENITVVLHTELTEDLEKEGTSREVVNRIQTLRKQSNLAVSDRIKLEIIAPQDIIDAVDAHEEFIKEETLCEEICLLVNGGECSLKFIQSYTINEQVGIIIAIEKI